MRYLRGLRVQILIWTILPLILILVTVSLSSIKLHQDTMRDMVSERNAHVAGLVAARLDDQLRMRSMALETVLQSFDDLQNSDQIPTSVDPVMEHFDLGIIIYDQNNIPLTEVSPAVLHADAEVQKILSAAQVTPGQTTYQLISIASSSRMFMMARTDPDTRRTAVGVVSLQGLNQPDLLGHVNRSPRREVNLISTDGRVIYHQDEDEIGRDYLVHAGVEQALRGKAGATFEQLDGEDEHVVGYAPVLTTGWAILIEEPWMDVIVPGLQYWLWAPILVLVAAVASLGAVHFGLWKVIRPLQVLGREASRLAWGDFQALEKPVGGIGEIREMQSTLQEMAAQIHRYQTGMQDYIAVLTQTQEDERKRLARELHDVIVQTVIAMGQRVKILQLDWRDHCGKSPSSDSNEVDLRLNKLSEMVAQCLEDVRSMIRDLRPVYLDELGLVSALEALSHNADYGKIEVAFEVRGDERTLLRETNLAIYRIAQAAIANAVRHGLPDLIFLKIEFREEGVVLTIEDDGSGFVPPERPSDLALHSHFGLVGMHERAIRLGGHLSIRSQPGAGTTIVAFLPYSLPSGCADQMDGIPQ
jgi:signal transduction histidine kinase